MDFTLDYNFKFNFLRILFKTKQSSNFLKFICKNENFLLCLIFGKLINAKLKFLEKFIYWKNYAQPKCAHFDHKFPTVEFLNLFQPYK